MAGDMVEKRVATPGFQGKRERIREKMREKLRIEVGMKNKNEETTYNVRREIEFRRKI